MENVGNIVFHEVLFLLRAKRMQYRGWQSNFKCVALYLALKTPPFTGPISNVTRIAGRFNLSFEQLQSACEAYTVALLYDYTRNLFTRAGYFAFIALHETAPLYRSERKYDRPIDRDKFSLKEYSASGD